MLAARAAVEASAGVVDPGAPPAPTRPLVERALWRAISAAEASAAVSFLRITTFLRKIFNPFSGTPGWWDPPRGKGGTHLEGPTSPSLLCPSAPQVPARELREQDAHRVGHVDNGYAVANNHNFRIANRTEHLFIINQ